MTKLVLAATVCVALLMSVGTAEAKKTAEQKCLASRANAKGKYQQCVEKWLAKGYGGGELDQGKLSKCRAKYAAKWTKLQGLIGSTTCNVERFVSNGTTVTDNLTGLVWELKTTVVDSGTDFAGNRHDVDNFYAWTTSDGNTTDEDGDVFTDFLTNLNGGVGFVSANGWRLPTFAELQTIVLPESYPCTTNPCIDAMFGPTQSSNYWSSTTHASGSDVAWCVSFLDGFVFGGAKPTVVYARAVRGGL